MRIIDEQCHDCIVASVHAQEANGINQLPVAYAYAFEPWNAMEIETDIVQINCTLHTGMNAAGRLLSKPKFWGKVHAGRKYLLVDDVATSGSTFGALRVFIEARGGKVVACSTLALTSSPVCGWSGDLAPTEETMMYFEELPWSGELSALLLEHGLNVDHLTNSQLRYVQSFKSVESLRKKLNEKAR